MPEKLKIKRKRHEHQVTIEALKAYQIYLDHDVLYYADAYSPFVKIASSNAMHLIERIESLNKPKLYTDVTKKLSISYNYQEALLIDHALYYYMVNKDYTFIVNQCRSQQLDIKPYIQHVEQPLQNHK